MKRRSSILSGFSRYIVGLSFLLSLVVVNGCTPPNGGGNDPTPISTPNPLDLDTDGIPDDLEAAGATYLGMPLYDWGARPGQTDLFIEIDYMDSTSGGQYPVNEGVIPHILALEKVVDVFSQRGIALHFDVGDLYDQSGDGQLNPQLFDLGGGQEIPYQAQISLDNYAPTYRQQNMESNKQSLFYYVLFGVNHATENVLGQGYLHYPEAIITLAQFTLDGQNVGLTTDSPDETSLLVNMQASTLMHELGHNLGLNHGGSPSDGNNFKPNYLSTMNYMYTFLGIPEVGTLDEATPYYLWSRTEDNTPPFRDGICTGSQFPDTLSDLAHSPFTDHFVIDFSDGVNDPIDENDVLEPFGIGTGSGVSVDFDCDGVIESNVAIDVNKDADIPGLSTLTDHNDWSNLYFYFAANASFLSGQLSIDQSTVPEPGIVHEPPVPDRVLDKIRKRREELKELLETKIPAR